MSVPRAAPKRPDAVIDLREPTAVRATSSNEAVRVLVIEADPGSVGAAATLLRRMGFPTSTAATVTSALSVVATAQIDAVLLDAENRLTQATEMVRRLRAASNVPILVASANDDELDVVLMYELGADGILRKPVRPLELAARITTLVRRDQPPAKGAKLIAGRITIDRARNEILFGETMLPPLPSKDFAVLEALARHAGRAVTKKYLLDTAWGPGGRGSVKTLSSVVQRIRMVLGDDQLNPTIVVTIRGFGYRLNV